MDSPELEIQIWGHQDMNDAFWNWQWMRSPAGKCAKTKISRKKYLRNSTIQLWQGEGGFIGRRHWEGSERLKKEICLSFQGKTLFQGNLINCVQYWEIKSKEVEELFLRFGHKHISEPVVESYCSFPHTGPLFPGNRSPQPCPSGKNRLSSLLSLDRFSGRCPLVQLHPSPGYRGLGPG